jgi:glutaminase
VRAGHVPDVYPALSRVDQKSFWIRLAGVDGSAGLYETSGDWLYVGVPAKSGIGGGIVTVAPGKGGLGTFAPPLDRAGNSVRGQLAARFLSRRLWRSLFASSPADQAGTVPRQSNSANR